MTQAGRLVKFAAFSFVFAASVANPAATVNQIYCANAVVGEANLKPGLLIFDAPLIMNRDAAGRAHLGVGLSGAPGLVMVGGGHASDVFVDSSYVTYRTLPPSAPGACEIATGGWAAGDGYFYACVPNPARTGFVWARAALITTW